MISATEERRGTSPRRELVVPGAGRKGEWNVRGRMRVPALALAMAVLPTTRALAGVEYVTRTTDCTSQVVSAASTLIVFAGPNMQFEVWGNSVDLSNPTSGFSFTGPAGSTARIVAQRSGVFNQSRGCGFVGSSVVELDSPGTLAADAAASVSFKMPLGDLSRLSITIKARPTFTTTWTTNGAVQPSTMPCLVKTGSITTLNQDTKLAIQLPPGSSQDQTTCTSNTIQVVTRPVFSGPTNIIQTSMKYTVTGLPAFITASQAVAALPEVPGTIVFTFNVAAIRALTATSTSTITITDPVATNRSAALVLVVTPTPGQGFASVATANPVSTTAGNPIDFTVHLSAPAGANQVITWRMTTATCFEQANSDAPYKATLPFQFFTFPQGQASANIRVRSVNNGGCTDRRAPVTHIFEAWTGDSRTNPQVTAVTSGPTYTRVNVSLTAP